MAGPSDQEQLLLEYVNDARLDPLGDAARYITSYATLTSPDHGIQNAITAFGVNGAALQSAYAALVPVQPLAWNANLAAGALGHDQVMIAQDSQTHQGAGELALGDRFTAAGYTGWRTGGENVYAYASSVLDAHAGFMIDWGTGANGMQDPAGHRVNIMNGTFSEIGISITGETNPLTTVGPLVVTEDLGARANMSFVLGVAYTDADHNDFYSVGEGRGDLTVTVAGSSATSFASGGYELAKSAAAQTVVLTGGGLSGALSVGIAAGGNVKLDVVNGSELKASGSVTVSGPVTTIEGIGVGVGITVGDTRAHMLIGTSGSDTLIGGAGADTIQGNAGGDVLTGGGGADVFTGAAGDLNGDTITDFTSGDSISITGSVAKGFSYTLTDSVLHFGASAITLTGFAGQLIAGTGAQGQEVLTAQAPLPPLADTSAHDGTIVFQNTNGSVSTWTLSATDQLQQGVFNGWVDPSWKIVETFDMNGDGRSDILWRNTNGTLSVWDGAAASGFQQGSFTSGAVGNDWRVAAVGDINGDGKDDILWQNTGGAVSAWQSTGTGFAQNSYFHGSPGAGWTVEGLADLNGDGKADLVWRNTNGGLATWMSTGSGFAEGGYFNGGVPSSWHIAGLGDFNGDGKDDILWRSDSGAVSIWRSNGSGFDQGVFNSSVDPSWHVAQVGDFNGDGKADILWHSDTGGVTDWQSNGTGFDQAFYSSAPTSWGVAAHGFPL